MHKRLKKARKALWLSKRYVAKRLGITVMELSSIEAGYRAATDDELNGFSRLYGLSVSDLLNGETYGDEERRFFEMFPNLSHKDKIEIANLIRWKRRLCSNAKA